MVADEGAAAVDDVGQEGVGLSDDFTPVLPTRPVELDSDQALAFRRVIGEDVERRVDIGDDACLAGELARERPESPLGRL